MLFFARALVVFAPLLTPHAPPHVRLFAAEGGASGDALLMEATTALRGGEASKAKELLAAARDAYGADITEEQQQLLSLVSERVDQAVVPGFGRTTPERPPAPTKEEIERKAEAKAQGDRAMMLTVQIFGDKTDEARFGKALAMLEEAKASFRRAGSEVERERDGVVGNLYAVIRAEEERSQRVAKLVRMKRLLELTKQKKKAEALGIDGDEFEEMVVAQQQQQQQQQQQPAPAAGGGGGEAVEAAEEEDLTSEILEEWRSEGLDAEGKEVEELQRQIDDLEDTL